MNKPIRFEQNNEPNAAKLIESLRCLGYDNYGAVADIVDNSLDAEADIIKVRFWTEDGAVRLMIADNGAGMDQEILDQALRLGSLTTKNPISDLGKFGMGLVTAGLSLARQTTVITRQGETFLTSVVDVDAVIKKRAAHTGPPCVPCEKFPGQYSNSAINQMNYMVNWLNKPGRF